MHGSHSKDREDKYNDKYMEKDKDKDRQRQELQRISEGGPFALSINIPRLKTEIEFFFEFDNDY